jgi:hypothetical protein
VSTYAYEERHALRDALPALGKLAALLFIVGCIYVIDYFVRAMFGSVSGAVGWIPYAGKILTAPVHRIEQKVTHSLGTAEQTIDRHIAASFHKLAKIIRNLPRELAMQAAMVLAVVGALDQFLTFKNFRHLLASSLHWLKAQVHMHNSLLHRHGKAITHAQHDATHAEKGSQVVAAQAASLTSRWWRTRVNSRLRAEEMAIARLWRWVRGRPFSFTSKAFIGATAWALAALGVSWIRCSKWRSVGKRVCHFPGSFLEGLLGFAFAFLVVADPKVIARAAVEIEDEFDSVIKGLANPSKTATDATELAMKLLRSPL